MLPLLSLQLGLRVSKFVALLDLARSSAVWMKPTDSVTAASLRADSVTIQSLKALVFIQRAPHSQQPYNIRRLHLFSHLRRWSRFSLTHLAAAFTCSFSCEVGSPFSVTYLAAAFSCCLVDAAGLRLLSSRSAACCLIDLLPAFDSLSSLNCLLSSEFRTACCLVDLLPNCLLSRRCSCAAELQPDV